MQGDHPAERAADRCSGCRRNGSGARDRKLCEHIVCRCRCCRLRDDRCSGSRRDGSGARDRKLCKHIVCRCRCCGLRNGRSCRCRRDCSGARDRKLCEHIVCRCRCCRLRNDRCSGSRRNGSSARNRKLRQDIIRGCRRCRLRHRTDGRLRCVRNRDRELRKCILCSCCCRCRWRNIRCRDRDRSRRRRRRRVDRCLCLRHGLPHGRRNITAAALGILCRCRRLHAAVMLGVCTLALEHTLLFLKLCRHFLVGFTDQMLCDDSFALFAGDLHHIGHLTDRRIHLDVFGSGVVDPARGSALIFRCVDHGRICLFIRNQDYMHVNQYLRKAVIFLRIPLYYNSEKKSTLLRRKINFCLTFCALQRKRYRFWCS